MPIDPDKLIRNAEKGEPRSLNAVYDIRKEGARSVMKWILSKYHVITKREIDNDKEEIYVYADGFYSRGEELLRTAAYNRFTSLWEEALSILNELWGTLDRGEAKIFEKFLSLINEFESWIKEGAARNKVDEVLAQIRLHTFTDSASFNPPTHIPFQNGLLRLEDWTLVSHTPELIFLWRVEANLLIDKIGNVSLNDCPLYKKFLLELCEPWDIPMLLEYGGYALYPRFPRHKVLWLVGRPRTGKGVTARIWKLLNPAGYGSISFEKLMIAENRFAFQKIEGKNLLVDPEVKRKFRKGARPDYGNYNTLFGGDTVDLEKKGRTSGDHQSKAKGLFLGNLPLPPVDDEPFISRNLVVKVRDNIISDKDRIDDIENVILGKERDIIVTLLVRYLRVLQSNNWNFISELSVDATMVIWDMFANVISFYLDENIVQEEGHEIPCDEMYESFIEWCEAKGIPVMKSQQFKKSVGYVYPKRKAGTKKNRYYVFTNCDYSDQTDLEVGHQINVKRSRNIRALYYAYRPCPTWGVLPDMKEKKENSKRIEAPMLDTIENDPPERRNKPPQTTQTVSNLQSGSGFDKPMQPVQPIQKSIPDDIYSQLKPPNERIYRNYKVIKEFTSQGLHYSVGYEFKPYDSPEVRSWLADGRIMEIPDDSGEVPASEDLRIYQEQMRSEGLTFVAILKDHPPIAWDGGNFYLHANDMISLPSRLAELLIGRGAAREVQP